MVEVPRKMGVSEQTLYVWNKKFGDCGDSELRRLRQIEVENRKLKQRVADLNLDKVMLQEALAKKGLKPARKRDLVGFLKNELQASHCWTCGLVGLIRSTSDYRHRRQDEPVLRARIR